LVAASTSKHATVPRAFLFVIPALAILTTRGSALLVSRGRMPIVLVGVVGLAIVLSSASYGTVVRFRAATHTDLLDTMRHHTEHVRPRDTVYLHLSVQLDSRYYLKCRCFGPARLSEGTIPLARRRPHWRSSLQQVGTSRPRASRNRSCLGGSALRSRG
jgi:hypothetical protein